MRLSARLHKLEGTVRPARRAGSVPTDPVAFGRGFMAGTIAVEDLDPTDPDHTGWAAQVTAFLVTLSPEHQAWLRRVRDLDPRAYPGALLLPAPDDQVLAALDAVMRRG